MLEHYDYEALVLEVSDNGSEEERPSWVVRVVNHHWFDAFFSVVVWLGGMASALRVVR